jgi:hypothetical protein
VTVFLPLQIPPNTGFPLKPGALLPIRLVNRNGGHEASMTSILRSGSATLIFMCAGFALPAQTPAQPGDVALRSSAQPVLAENRNGLLPADGSSISPLNKVTIAQAPERTDRKAKLVWKISIAALVTASAMDAATSMGKYEGNGLLRGSDGKFGGKGIALKAGIAGITLIPQLLLRNHENLRKPFTIANFAQAGMYSAIAIHNAGIAKPKN